MPAPPTSISPNAPTTFAIFVTATGNVPFDPGTNRIFVRFKDFFETTCDGVTTLIVRGETSVAVWTQ